MWFRDNAFVHALMWLIAMAVLVVLVIAPAVAQVPREAASFKREYTRIVRSEWGLDAPIATLAAQVQAESNWRCNAVSRVGARSCTQFMPATAKWANEVAPQLRQDEIFSPAWAFRAQGWFMKWLHERTRADTACERMAFALASYNGGEGWTRKRQKLSKTPGKCLRATCDINPGISLASQRENVQYPTRIFDLESRYSAWGPRSCVSV